MPKKKRYEKRRGETSVGVDACERKSKTYHVAENMLSVGQDLVGGVALDVDNEADAARVLLVLGVVQTLGHGQNTCPGIVLFINGKVVGLLMEVVFSKR